MTQSKGKAWTVFSVLYICSNKIFPFVISKKYSQLKQKLSLSYA